VPVGVKVCHRLSAAVTVVRPVPLRAVLCHGGAAPPPGARNKSRIVRLGTSSVRSCRMIPGHAVWCRPVPPGAAWCRILSAC